MVSGVLHHYFLLNGVTSENGTLVAKAGDQPGLALSYRGNHHFENVKENIRMTFNPAQNNLILLSGGQEYVFVKERSETGFGSNPTHPDNNLTTPLRGY